MINELNEQPKKLTPKTVALLTALPFAAECIRQGPIVSEPLGDDARYDIIVDNGQTLVRVQVKAAHRVRHGVYRFNGRRRNMIYHSPGSHVSGPAARITSYAPGEIDCVVTRVLDQWYLYTEPHKFGYNVLIYTEKFDLARANWKAIGLPVDVQVSQLKVA
jgi:hypothetical protein